MKDTPVVVEQFSPDDWRVFRDLRLRALAESPDAFGSTFAREAERSDDDWARSLSRGARSEWELPLLARVGAEASGLAWARIDEAESTTVYLYQVWVTPERRRLGVGRALLDAAVAWARSRGARAMVLDVSAASDAATRLYEEAGFIRFGTPKPLRPGSAVTAQSLRLSLDRP